MTERFVTTRSYILEEERFITTWSYISEDNYLQLRLDILRVYFTTRYLAQFFKFTIT
jgi:hypothetical protein